MTTAPQEKTPNPLLNVVGSGPYAGNMSVNVSGNFDSLSQVDRMILQITDSNGVVDNSTYITTQARASFSVDTTRFANGNLKLEVIAYTKTGLRGVSQPTSLAIQNLTSPDLAVAAPSDGATVNSPNVPVKVTLTKRSADFLVNPQTIQVDVLDFRGVIAVQTTLNTSDPAVCIGSVDSLTCNTQFDMAGFPADTYTIRVCASVQVDPAGANLNRNLETTSRFTSNTVSVLPPAATIRFPAITNLRTVGQIDSSSGFLVNVSDDTGVSVVEARIVGPFDANAPLSLNGTSQCKESVPVGTPVDVLLLNYGLVPPELLGDILLPSIDINGSAYVPDNQVGQRYDLRVTTIDIQKNRNIQCIPVAINRASIRASRIDYVLNTDTTPSVPDTTSGKLNYTAGSWSISNLQNDSRVAGIVYLNNAQQSISFTASTDTSATVALKFADEGTYQVVWLVEDMTTGIVTSRAGSYISVKKNP